MPPWSLACRRERQLLRRGNVSIIQKEESAGSNPAVKAYAARYLPVLRTHLGLAGHTESVLRVTPTR